MWSPTVQSYIVVYVDVRNHIGNDKSVKRSPILQLSSTCYWPISMQVMQVHLSNRRERPTVTYHLPSNKNMFSTYLTMRTKHNIAKHTITIISHNNHKVHHILSLHDKYWCHHIITLSSISKKHNITLSPSVLKHIIIIYHCHHIIISIMVIFVTI